MVEVVVQKLLQKKYVRAVYNGDADTVISMIYLAEKDKKEAGMQEMLSGKIKVIVAEA